MEVIRTSVGGVPANEWRKIVSSPADDAGHLWFWYGCEENLYFKLEQTCPTDREGSVWLGERYRAQNCKSLVAALYPKEVQAVIDDMKGFGAKWAYESGADLVPNRLELREAVALRLGYVVEEVADRNGNYEYWLYDPLGQVLNIVYAYNQYGAKGSRQDAWQGCPAFESDLGALQSIGIVSKVLRFTATYGYGLNISANNAEQLAEDICRTFLKFDNAVWHEM